MTVTDIYRAKGNEADMVPVVGLDAVARDEQAIAARPQLFTALTRSRGWLWVSGAGCADSPLAQEYRRVIAGAGRSTFTYRRPPQRNLDEEEGGAAPGWVSDWV